MDKNYIVNIYASELFVSNYVLEQKFIARVVCMNMPSCTRRKGHQGGHVRCTIGGNQYECVSLVH